MLRKKNNNVKVAGTRKAPGKVPKKPSPKALVRKTPSVRGALAPDRIAAILKALDETYPEVKCALTHRSPWELLVATILSAQCTDVRVNMVTPELFRRFPTPQAMTKAKLPELEELIRTTGFFRNKAKSIQGAARRVVEEFGGQVPQTLAELITIPGAARKTANVVLGVCFGKAEGVVVDTHVFRIARRLGLAKAETAEKVEQELGADHSAGPLDCLLAPAHPSWPPGVRCPQGEVRSLQSRAALHVERQDLAVVITQD